MYIKYISITVPAYFNIIVIKKNNYYNVMAYSANKYCAFWIKKENINFKKNSHGINVLQINPESKTNINLYHHFTHMIMKSWEFFFYRKFKFKSKGLKIRRKKKNY